MSQYLKSSMGAYAPTWNPYRCSTFCKFHKVVYFLSSPTNRPTMKYLNTQIICEPTYTYVGILSFHFC